MARIVRGEQRPQRLLVTLLLKGMIGPDGASTRNGRACLDRVEPLLDIRIRGERIALAFHDAGRTIDPAPKRHVGDRVTVADKEIAAGEMVFDHLIMPLRLAPVAVARIVQSLRERRTGSAPPGPRKGRGRTR